MRQLPPLAAILILGSLIFAGNAPASGEKSRQLRFSGDGRYILAQDGSAITVLTVQPLSILFRVPAANAALARFSPDSSEVLYVSGVPRTDAAQLALASSPARVERWNIADRSRTKSDDVALQGCETVELAPNGRTVVCVDTLGTLRLIQVDPKRTLLEKKKFGVQFYSGTPQRPCYDAVKKSPCNYGDPGSAMVGFSQDSHFLIAEPWRADGDALAYDLVNSKPVTLEGRLKKLTQLRRLGPTPIPFAFVGPERVLLPGYGKPPGEHVINAAVVTFPSGEVVSRTTLPPSQQLFSAADPNYVLVHPFGKASVEMVRSENSTSITLKYPDRTAAVEFGTGQIIVTEGAALDVFGPLYVAERTNGEIGLYRRGRGIQAAVSLTQP